MFEQQAAENAFLKDVNALRANARSLLDEEGFGEREIAIGLLQSVLSAEIVCVLRYTMMSVSHDGLKSDWIGAEFQEQANDERRHMRMAAERIRALGGKPSFNPGRPAARAPGGGSFAGRVQENLAAEQSVIEHYRDLLKYFAGRDVETCALLEEIIRDEEDHSSDMQDILGSYLG